MHDPQLPERVNPPGAATDAPRAPKVSVIIPNYNHARYLPRRIESVLGQQMQDLEVLLMDDCSTDDSRTVLAAYAARDPRVRLAFNEHNSGSTFRQWAKGLALTRGEYVWIAESDDFAEPGFLTALVARLDADPTAALAYANSWLVDEHDAVHGTMADWKNRDFATSHWAHSHRADGTEELRRYLSIACTINNASAVLFRRRSLAAVGVDTSFRYTGDWLVYIRLCGVGALAYEAACLSNYRDHSANASKQSVADGTLLYERLKCCAHLHRSGQLDAAAYEHLLSWSSRELVALSFLLLRQRREPRKWWAFLRGIAAVDAEFYRRLRNRAVRQFVQSKLRG